MDGSTAVGARARLVDDFNANERVFVFLLTTKVGGLGINLTGADRQALIWHLALATRCLLHTHCADLRCPRKSRCSSWSDMAVRGQQASCLGCWLHSQADARLHWDA